MREDCADIRPLLDAWIDGELSDLGERRVARHAAGCPACREEAESRRGIDAAISADDTAGDPGDAYFANLGDRVSARFDFAEAARHWAKPEKPPRKRRLEIPRAWVPRFAFGIAGVAVATIAGLLVHDLGQRPILAPLPPVSDTGIEARKSQTPVELPDSPGGMQTARRAPAPSVRPVGPQSPPQTVTPSAGPATAESDQAAKSTMDLRQVISRRSTAGEPAKPPAMLSPADRDVTPMEESFADHLAPLREPAPVQAAPGLAIHSRGGGTDSHTQGMVKERYQGEINDPAVPQDNAVSVRNRFSEDVSGADADARSSAFLAPAAKDAAGAGSAANAGMPDRTDLLSFFGALSEKWEDRKAVSSTEALSVADHEAPPASSGIADSTRPGRGRDEARAPADSTWIRLRRDEARTPADSTWTRLRRDEARVLADSAMAKGTLEDCESALRAYWAMLHRDGRPVLPTPAARATVLEPDRLRIAALLRCASR
jgi:anti-sigma factor RsiW